MRFASYLWGGQRQVGMVSTDGSTVTPLALPRQQAERGVLSIVELMAEGGAMPPAGGASLPIGSVQLDAPIPVPRRNVWCVGRNYHAHAKELQASVFKDNDANPESWPIVFTKVPECVVGPFDDIQMPVGISDQIDYEAELTVIISKGGKNIRKADAMKHVWGYTDRARRADAPPAVGHGQVL
jgi:2-keto-4-pentenoate hydratase/2-oxohepta-3-ene-1,7-dioic acid hydratase in catechol pathway